MELKYYYALTHHIATHLVGLLLKMPNVNDNRTLNAWKKRYRSVLKIRSYLTRVEKYPTCMKFVGKNSTDFHIEEKIRLGISSA
jgi:hypothetical protein